MKHLITTVADRGGNPYRGCVHCGLDEQGASERPHCGVRPISPYEAHLQREQSERRGWWRSLFGA